MRALDALRAEYGDRPESWLPRLVPDLALGDFARPAAAQPYLADIAAE